VTGISHVTGISRLIYERRDCDHVGSGCKLYCYMQ